MSAYAAPSLSNEEPILGPMSRERSEQRRTVFGFSLWHCLYCNGQLVLDTSSMDTNIWGKVISYAIKRAKSKTSFKFLFTATRLIENSQHDRT